MCHPTGGNTSSRVWWFRCGFRRCRPVHGRRGRIARPRARRVASEPDSLDVPCGGGRLSLALAERGYQRHRRRPGHPSSSATHARATRFGSRDMGTARHAGFALERDDSTAPSASATASVTSTIPGNAAFLRAVASRVEARRTTGARDTDGARESASATYRTAPGGRPAMSTCWWRITTITRGRASTSSTPSSRMAASKCDPGRIARMGFVNWWS